MVRLKHRYLLLQILYPSSSSTSPASSALSLYAPTPDTLTPALLARLIRDSISDLFGDHGSGVTASSLSIKYLSCPTSTAIVRVSRAHYRLVWAALTMGLTRVPGGEGGECVVRVLRVTGTVRKAEEELVRRGRAMVALLTKGGVVDGDYPGMGGIMDEDD